MTLISLIVILIVVGVLLWVVNNYLGEYIDPKFLKLINVAAVVVTILWILFMVFGGGSLGTIRVPTVR